MQFGLSYAFGGKSSDKE